MSQTTNLETADREALVDLMAAPTAPSLFRSRESRDESLSIIGDRAIAIPIVTTTKFDGTSDSYCNIRAFSWRKRRWCLDAWFNEPAQTSVTL